MQRGRPGQTVNEGRQAARAAERGLRPLRGDVTAGVEDKGAARRERAAAWPVERSGHNARNRGQAPSVRPLRQRRQKRGGIGMMRIGEQVARGVHFHLLASV